MEFPKFEFMLIVLLASFLSTPKLKSQELVRGSQSRSQVTSGHFPRLLFKRSALQLFITHAHNEDHARTKGASLLIYRVVSPLCMARRKF